VREAPKVRPITGAKS